MIKVTTLDEFKNEMSNIILEMKSKMIIVVSKGVEAKLDENLMIAIVNNEIEKMASGD